MTDRPTDRPSLTVGLRQQQPFHDDASHPQDNELVVPSDDDNGRMAAAAATASKLLPGKVGAVTDE